MKIGYSNFLGEHVAADHIDYGDCRDFQIVCPCCREPIFKSKRDLDGSTVHFLSHYRATNADVEECERRVKGLSTTSMTTYDSMSRGQRLDLFLAVLNEEVEALEDSAEVAEIRERLIANKGMPLLAPTIQGLVAKVGFDNAINKMLSIDVILGNRDHSPFERAQRTRAAEDVWRTILTRRGLPVVSRLAAQAAARILARRGTAATAFMRDFENRPDLRELIENLAYRRRSAYVKGLHKAKSIRVDPPQGFNSGSINLTKFLCYALSMEAARMVVSVDYMDVVRRRRQEQAAEHEEHIQALEAENDPRHRP